MLTHLPLNQLRLDGQNVRVAGRGPSPDFIASIKANGILVPLAVRQNCDGYLVTDGGKRFSAAQELVKSGDLAADAPIPVIVKTTTDAEARELSLTLNVIRHDMHPVDAFRAFSALHTDKERPLDVDAIAARFGIDARRVAQTLALGALHEDILTAWREGKISEDSARAFTLADKKEQARILAKHKGRVAPWQIKEELKIGADGRFLNIVSAAAYEARGGKITRDLFGEDHRVSNADLLRQMVAEAVKATCDKLLSEGWSFATETPKDVWSYRQIESSFPATKDEAKRLKALEKIIENPATDEDAEKANADYEALEAAIKLRSYTDDHKKKAGCFVTVTHAGTLDVQYGMVKPEAPKAPGKPAPGKPEPGKPAPTGTKSDGKGEAQPKGITQALADSLNEARRTALKSCLQAAHKDPLLSALAGIAAAQMNPKSRYSWAPNPIMAQEKALADLIEPKAMNAAIRKAFNAKDYFDRCGKQLCLAAITEAVNQDEARKVALKKSAEIAKAATVNVGKTLWLPKELRTGHYDGPQTKKK